MTKTADEISNEIECHAVSAIEHIKSLHAYHLMYKRYYFELEAKIEEIQKEVDQFKKILTGSIKLSRISR